MNEAENKKAAYDFYGKMPFRKAFPLGLQHVLAMFVANVTPVMLIASVAVYNGTCAAVRIGETGQRLGKVSQAFGKIVLIHNTQPFWKRSEGNPFISGYDRGRIFVPEPRGVQKAGHCETAQF